MRTIPCPTCGGIGTRHPLAKAPKPCPDCHNGQVPAPEAVEALAMHRRRSDRLRPSRQATHTARLDLLAVMRAGRRMKEPKPVWKCEFCGRFYSRRTAKKHAYCQQEYDRKCAEKAMRAKA